jgi:hypothetical protein
MIAGAAHFRDLAILKPEMFVQLVVKKMHPVERSLLHRGRAVQRHRNSNNDGANQSSAPSSRMLSA